MVWEFIGGMAVIATMFAVFTNWSIWIGLGLFGAFLASFLYLKAFVEKHDHSGDAILGFGLMVVAPSLIASIMFFVAALVRFLVLKLVS